MNQIDVTTTNLEELDLSELNSLATRIQTTIRKKEAARVKQLRDDAKSIARAQGISVEELLRGFSQDKPSGKKRGRKKSAIKTTTRKVAPKYRNPENIEETWTGRGQLPRWIRAKLEAGANKDDFLIRD
ncbi:MAG TPA: H-NS histone family protein [Gammaproteobacteria bacterium]|nr:H-NS histone family protein [Gammaproteobacteria bacterium]